MARFCHPPSGTFHPQYAYTAIKDCSLLLPKTTSSEAAERGRFNSDWRIEMLVSYLLVLVVGFVVLIAMLGALILIGLAVHRSRKKIDGETNQPNP
jgi:hypothetical protein